MLKAVPQKQHRESVADVGLQPLLRDKRVQPSFCSLTTGNGVGDAGFQLR